MRQNALGNTRGPLFALRWKTYVRNLQLHCGLYVVGFRFPSLWAPFGVQYVIIVFLPPKSMRANNSLCNQDVATMDPKQFTVTQLSQYRNDCPDARPKV